MAITRRNVLAGAAVAGGLPLAQYNLCMPAFAADDDVVLGPPVKDQPIQKLSPHIYMVEAPDGFPTPENQGLMSNIVFIVGKEGVIVIDSGASLQIARMSIRQLQTVTKAPVIGVFNTHYHGDHWLGNHGFVEAYGKEIPIYAMAGTRTAIEGGTGTSWRDAMLKWTNQASSGTRIIPPSKDVDHGFTATPRCVSITTARPTRPSTSLSKCRKIKPCASATFSWTAASPTWRTARTRARSTPSTS